MTQEPNQPLGDRLIEPCYIIPIKILSEILGLSISKLEFIIKDIYETDYPEKISAISFQYINRGIVEIISSNVSADVFKAHIEIENYNNFRLYKLKSFDPSK